MESANNRLILDSAAIGKVVLLFSLAFTVTNFVPLSVAFVIFLFGAVPVYTSKVLHCKVDTVVWVLVLLYVYFTVWVVLYSPSAFLDYMFYRRDGNFFITFLPIILFPFFRMNVDLSRVIRCFLIWAVAVSLLSYIVYLTEPNKPIFHGLFFAHNAAGGYFAMLSAIAFGFFCSEKKILDLIVALIFVFLLMESDSRGSLVGLVLGMVCLLPFIRRFRWLLLGIGLLICLSFVAFYSHDIWILNGSLPAGFDVKYVDMGLPFERSHTVIDRLFFLWPRALDVWLRSPIFGLGFGAYNDIPYDIVGWKNIISMNRPTYFSFSDAHSHNSFFHVLAETGIFGFVLLLMFLKSLEGCILRCAVNGVRVGLLLAFWVAVWSSFTEHRLFTPSQMLPFTLLVGMLLAKSRVDREVGKIEIPLIKSTNHAF